MNAKIKYSWEKMHSDTICICNRVGELGFKPDIIVGIVRGGAIPAVIASHIFNVPVEFLNWSLRDLKGCNIIMVDRLTELAKTGTKILVVEDIVDSGETMFQIKSLLQSPETHGSRTPNVLYASLWYNPTQTKVHINIWANIIDRSLDDRWVIFPFEE